MASAILPFSPIFNLQFSSPSVASHQSTSSYSFSSLTYPCQRRSSQRHLRLPALGSDLLGDFGARDPFPEEIASNFGENVLGNTDTMHRILIPNISVLSLAELSCEPVLPSQPPISIEDAAKLLRKIVGWRIAEADGIARLQCLWKVRDYGCGVELITRIHKVAEASGHYPNLHLEQPNHVRAELWTSSIGGLSMNDFIMAAKIDKVRAVDLLPKKRIWA
ncbi:probable pterin-4-alpha-carbinolamine dehydratase, chloroplastic [Typha latifolia]|uniref:probable pterin-4-alpha-carbinolamine dehydratase, chloroplastic n=1 Tax=Typha latifolia TaxID=4733 RepID=UPI003C2E0B3A